VRRRQFIQLVRKVTEYATAPICESGDEAKKTFFKKSPRSSI